VAELQEKATWFRDKLKSLGLKPLEGESAIVPVILGETSTAIRVANEMLDQGIFVTGFGFPVVPEGEARVRFQVSYLHTKENLQKAAETLAAILT